MSDQYPFSVVPQVHSPEPSSTNAGLSCPPDDSQKFIIFGNCNKLAVVQGWETKSSTELKEFFVPIESYMEYEFVLKYDADFLNYTILNYGNIGDSIEGVPFLMIFPMYHLTDIEDQGDWELLYRFSDDPTWDPIDGSGVYPDNSAGDATTWRRIGRMFLQDGTDEYPVKPIYLQNRTGKDIPLKILIAK